MNGMFKSVGATLATICLASTLSLSAHNQAGLISRLGSEISSAATSAKNGVVSGASSVKDSVVSGWKGFVNRVYEPSRVVTSTTVTAATPSIASRAKVALANFGASTSSVLKSGATKASYPFVKLGETASKVYAQYPRATKAAGAVAIIGAIAGGAYIVYEAMNVNEATVATKALAQDAALAKDVVIAAMLERHAKLESDIAGARTTISEKQVAEKRQYKTREESTSLVRLEQQRADLEKDIIIAYNAHTSVFQRVFNILSAVAA